MRLFKGFYANRSMEVVFLARSVSMARLYASRKQRIFGTLLELYDGEELVYSV